MASGRQTRQRGARDSNGSLRDPEQKNTDNDMKRMREMERQERNQLKLFKRPLRTLCYFIFELGCLASSICTKLWHRKLLVMGVAALLLGSSFVYQVDGPHQPVMNSLRKYVLVSSYWIGLGILSSVGLGTGLHTFLLYLGPFIAQVTLASYECMSTNFPEPPYPAEIICPDEEEENLTFWMIMTKVRLEAIMWGVGTALGELPPYFMARAARLSGTEDEEEDLEELEELIHEKRTRPQDLGMIERGKIFIHNVVQKVGFLGILACASIPNPLFDLAGITCGHFLIPFWTFFGATLIGKAVVKMHIQKAFVIFLFSKHHVEQMVRLMQKLPVIGPSVQAPFSNWLEQQKKKLHHKPGLGVEEEGNLLSTIFEKVLIAMVIYFLISIINSMAQRYHKRLCKAKHIVGDSVYTKRASKTT